MIKAKVTGNVVQVDTGIPVGLAERQLRVLDDKKAEIYKVSQTDDPFISKYGLGCNVVINGNLGVLCTVDLDAEPKDIKKMFGLAIVAANAYIPQILAEAEAEEAVINDVFDFE